MDDFLKETFKNRDSRKFKNPEISNLITSQHQYELDQLIDIYKRLKPRYVLEIGTQEGGTLYHWCKHAKQGTVICNIDILENQPANRHEELVNRWHSWRKPNTELFTHIGSSQKPPAVEFVKKHLPRIDFLFIDGNHRYQGVKADFLTYAPYVKNGVIAFHDLMTPTNGIQNHIQVGKLWEEIRRAGFLTREIWCQDKQTQAWGGIGLVFCAER